MKNTILVPRFIKINIPEEWKIVRVKDLVEKHNSGIFKNKDLYGTGSNIIGVVDLYEHGLVNGQIFGLVELTDEEKNGKTLVEHDLLYAESSLVREGIGKTIYVTKKGEGTIFAWHTRRFSLKKGTDPKFIYFQLNSSFTRNSIISRSTTTALTGITTKEYLGTKIPIPPIKEQKKIAEILSNIDELILETSNLIKQNQLLKKNVHHLLCFSGVNNSEFKKVRIGHNPYQLSEIPKSWDYVEMGTTGNFINGLNKNKEDYGHGCLHVNIDNIFESFIINTENLGRVNATPSEIERYRLVKNDICLLRSSVKPEGIGYPTLFNGSKDPIVFSGFIIRFRPNPKLWNSIFLTHLLRTNFIRKNVIAWSTVSANTNINQKSFGKLPLPLPSLDEQNRIVEILSNIDIQIQKNQKYKSKLKTLKKGLKQKLLSGLIRVDI